MDTYSRREPDKEGCGNGGCRSRDLTILCSDFIFCQFLFLYTVRAVVAQSPSTKLSAKLSPGTPLPNPGQSHKPRKDTLLLMMSISFAGLGLMSLRRPFSEILGLVLGKGDIQSILCLIVFCIVFFVLAYLTNPSENSFRAYLTELSFRQHLSRLDDANDDDPAVQEKSPSSHLSFRTGSPSVQRSLPFDNRSPFHFANRASVSLRTPKHVFHSFGIFTIAAIIPLGKSDRVLQDQRDNSIISDSWFIGAFGKWWRGGVLEAWYQDVIARSADEESWSSGILGMKTLDRLNEMNAALPGLPFSTRHLSPHGFARSSPPRLRNREKSNQRLIPAPPRSSTPPPLPKSVTLPLHAPRTAQSPSERQAPSHSHSSPVASDSFAKPAPTFDQSPRVVELLHQISQSKTTIRELCVQLTESQSVASQSHASLQAELETFRDRKRSEDAAKNEVKFRTKSLEDSKRVAESAKRDTEKKLRAAETAREDAAQRIEYLDRDIVNLQTRLTNDTDYLDNSRRSKSKAELGLAAELEHKKREIKAAEDVVATLSLRARELEERLVEKRKHVIVMRGRSEAHKQQQSPVDLWSTSSDLPLIRSRNTSSYAEFSDTLSSDDASLVIREDTFAGKLESSSDFDRPNTRSGPHFAHQLNIRPSLPATFSPFADEIPQSPSGLLSPSASSSLIPSSLILSLDNADELSRSFQSDSDIFLERDWREKGQQSSDDLTTTSPSLDRFERDPFEIRVFTPHEHDRFILPSLLKRNNSDPSTPTYGDGGATITAHQNRSRHRLSISKSKTRKGLNPDAKVFDITRSQSKAGIVSSVPSMSTLNTPVYDALNPNGMAHSSVSSTTADNNFLRAFAPSPAEREALQRALGGSTNGSLERLPSLSDVGSIPPSPSHVHATAAAHSPSRFEQSQRDPVTIPSWLRSLPRIRKSNFSPWDDDATTSASGAVSSGTFL
ncbi:hypothetical protein D9757_004340 [Collybiopsis confluens]|uniref:Uncharacterized protein n=1 Tax=Collybiopsis confluens TaxID=2823264 RepID=A0A8H5HUF1_9AGAR|nr:hypothetical protein D9757_004340 [Collybiopsis confluens]